MLCKNAFARSGRVAVALYGDEKILDMFLQEHSAQTSNVNERERLALRQAESPWCLRHVWIQYPLGIGLGLLGKRAREGTGKMFLREHFAPSQFLGATSDRE
jgi:hypothetical protein